MTRTASCGQENYFYSSEDLSNDETRGWEVWPSPSNIQNDMWNLSRAAHARPTDHKLCSLHITRGWRLQQGNIGSGYKLNNGIISQRGHSSQIQTPAPATLPPPPPLTQLCFREPNLRATLYFFENLYRIWGGGLRATCNFVARVGRVNVARVLRSQVFYLSNSFG